ncbi:cell division protein FtsB [Pseudohaliea rubra]|uniref:Cell division protein FtsB n=1 Tax=Pseudohaliea rubra DSM 19751 TaxID=1265313 RepID=A0A095XZ59_9GAMM|nr:cell division protein FtsB [Pseudohaliea rubra]KGE05036.1 Cell division protein DivIC (FtsB), stabilizes FtsL against RasP cleavage [Pseudohaliea rubra DSM 19751]
MRWLLLVLACLVLVLQYRLWFAEGSLAERQRLQRLVQDGERDNARLRARNEELAREVLDLQSGKAVVEQRAREELNLVGDGEVFYQFLEEGATPSPPRKP